MENTNEEKVIKLTESYSKTVQVNDYEPEQIFSSVSKEIEADSSIMRVRLEKALLKYDCELSVLEEMTVMGLVDEKLLPFRRQRLVTHLAKLYKKLQAESESSTDERLKAQNKETMENTRIRLKQYEAETK